MGRSDPRVANRGQESSPQVARFSSRPPSKLLRSVNVWIERRVARALVQAASDSAPCEAGGVLAGWVNGSDLVVCYATVGGSNAVATPISYVPDHDWQVRELTNAFGQSGGDLTYLGDWHSHPAGPLRLSGTDQRTIRDIARVRPECCMLLCAKQRGNWAMAAWQVRKSFRRFRHIVGVPIRSFYAPSDWPVAVSFEKKLRPTERTRVR